MTVICLRCTIICFPDYLNSFFLLFLHQISFIISSIYLTYIRWHFNTRFSSIRHVVQHRCLCIRCLNPTSCISEPVILYFVYLNRSGINPWPQNYVTCSLLWLFWSQCFTRRYEDSIWLISIILILFLQLKSAFPIT